MPIVLSKKAGGGGGGAPSGPAGGDLSGTYPNPTINSATVTDETGWISNSTELTRTGNFTFTESGDTTAKWGKGTRFEYTQSAVTEYGVVISSSHAAGTTTVTLATNSDYAMAAGSLDSPRYSYAVSPRGYPTWFDYTPANETGWSTANPFSIARFNVLGTAVMLQIYATGTSDSATTTFDAPIDASAGLVGLAQGSIFVQNGGSNAFGRWYFSTATQLKFGVSVSSDTWTASATKSIQATLLYEMA